MFIPITLSNYFSPMKIITLPKPFSFSTQNSLRCIDCSDIPLNVVSCAQKMFNEVHFSTSTISKNLVSWSCSAGCSVIRSTSYTSATVHGTFTLKSSNTVSAVRSYNIS